MEITAVKILTEYLNTERSYLLIKRIYNRSWYDCYCYKKLTDEITIGWKDQRINQITLAYLSLKIIFTKLMGTLIKLIKNFR